MPCLADCAGERSQADPNDRILFMTNSRTCVLDRPILRGYSHLVAAIVAPFGLLVLLLVADSPRGIVGGAIFGSGLIILYSTSAIYHLVPLGRRLRALVGRLDNSSIFVFIAATTLRSRSCS